MKLAAVRLLTILTFLLLTRAMAIAAPPPELVDHLKQLAEEVRARHHLPALAVAAIRSDGPGGSCVVGTLAAGGDAAATRDHLFHVGSCTKAMTATMIGKLIDDGKLSWDTTIQEVFPELIPNIKVEYAEVTLRQLLTHTAGIPPATAGLSKEYAILNVQKGTPMEQRAAMLQPLLSLDPVAPPGTKHVYSNAGYGVAAAMAERITGRAWEDLMQEMLFTPLEMKSATFGWPATTERPDQPMGYFPGPAGRQPVMELTNPYRLAPAARPAGDVSSTIDDFARFAQEHLRGLRGEATILTKETMKKLHEPALANYACGWVNREIGGKPADWHNGCAGPFFAWMTIWPEEDLAVVVLTNCGAGEPACAEITAAALTLFSPPPSGKPE